MLSDSYAVPMMRVASCSVRGLPETFSARRNARHGQLLREVVAALGKDAPLDAVVLSGGYFVDGESNAFLYLSFEERCALLRAMPFAEDVQSAADSLHERRDGALLIFGVDTGKRRKDPQGDQLCVAWSAAGPVGIGRKVFPTEWEGHNGFVVNVDDFHAQERVVQVGKHRILLCSCYDGYGVANSPDKSRYIRTLVSGGRWLAREAGSAGNEFRQALEKGLTGWSRLVESASAAAIAIHHFGAGGKPFSTSYWRRHGIATASAKLGGWAVAGANFHGRLPNADVDILAADRVPYAHIAEGQRRGIRDATKVRDYVIGDSEVRVGMFDFNDVMR